MCSFQFWISWQKIGPTLFMFILFTSFTSFTLELVPEQRSLAWLSRKAGKAPKFGWSFESKWGMSECQKSDELNEIRWWYLKKTLARCANITWRSSKIVEYLHWMMGQCLEAQDVVKSCSIWTRWTPRHDEDERDILLLGWELSDQLDVWSLVNEIVLRLIFNLTHVPLHACSCRTEYSI